MVQASEYLHACKTAETFGSRIDVLRETLIAVPAINCRLHDRFRGFFGMAKAKDGFQRGVRCEAALLHPHAQFVLPREGISLCSVLASGGSSPAWQTIFFLNGRLFTTSVAQ